MAIELSRTFGARTNAKRGQANEDFVKAEYWINIGYTVEVETDEGVVTRFVSLPTGIPLDTMEKLNTSSRNNSFAAFQSARNGLLDQLMEMARPLQPGEESIIAELEGGLQIQVRRINVEVKPIAAEANPFARTLAIAS